MMSHKNKGSKELISCNLHFKGSIDDWNYEYFNLVLTLFQKYSKFGVLPFPGSHADQPAKIIEIFELLEQLDFERQEKNRREQEREQQKAIRQNNRKGRK